MLESMESLDAREPRPPRQSADGQERPLLADEAPPPEIVRQVASQLKSLPKVLSYEEYAWIVHRVARLKWRCECADCPPPSPAVARDSQSAEVMDDMPVREISDDLRRAAVAYAELSAKSQELGDRVLRARSEVAASRLVVERDRSRRADELEARTRFRAEVAEFVRQLKARGASLDAVLHHTGGMMRLLRRSGEVSDEGGALVEEVMRWAAEEFCTAA